MNVMGIFAIINVFFGIIIGLYFWNLWRQQQSNKTAVNKESRKEMERLHHLTRLALTEPLSEKTRPSSFAEIIGQEDGLKALRAALCGPNPQHVIVYGPPGVGKTAVARLVLEEAKRNPLSPFTKEAVFIEVDATTARFDDRGIADPLMGSVHDPIYQGAGPLGMAGIPQPKPGAVSKAHGGMLFIDEIGELHPIQMNKLLKVLEDRRVFFDSAYYSPEDANIPRHIHEVFQKGLPADFRLVGATTRMPHDIPPAIRSRCLEVFFRPLYKDEIGIIARNAAAKVNFAMCNEATGVIERYATNGREAVNIVQIAGGIAQSESRTNITKADVEWVINLGQYSPRPERTIPREPQVGQANGLAVYGPNVGTLIEVEASAISTRAGTGELRVTGIMDEEELGGAGVVMKRRSAARSSLDNVLTVLRRNFDLRPQDYDIHVNFPGGVPIDGPSAGVTMVTAIYSAITGHKISNTVAMTGEVSIRGHVKPVGGVVPKVEAARLAGVETVLVPAENWQDIFGAMEEHGVEVVPIEHIDQVVARAVLGSPAAERAKVVPGAKGAQGAGAGAAASATFGPQPGVPV